MAAMSSTLMLEQSAERDVKFAEKVIEKVGKGAKIMLVRVLLSTRTLMLPCSLRLACLRSEHAAQQVTSNIAIERLRTRQQVHS